MESVSFATFIVQHFANPSAESNKERFLCIIWVKVCTAIFTMEDPMEKNVSDKN